MGSITVWSMPLFTRKRTHEPVLRSSSRAAARATRARSWQYGRCKPTGDICESCISPLRPFRSDILDAVGLQYCKDIVATIDLPRFDNSAIDGYAVRAEDVTDAAEDTRESAHGRRDRSGKAADIGFPPGLR